MSTAQAWDERTWRGAGYPRSIVGRAALGPAYLYNGHVDSYRLVEIVAVGEAGDCDLELQLPDGSSYRMRAVAPRVLRQ